MSNGEVIVTLNNNGDDAFVTFTVNGTQYPVGPKASVNATISGLADGTHTIEVFAGTLDLSFNIDVTCDHPGEGTISVLSDCAENDGQVIVTLIATGGELPVLFTVQGVDYLVDPDTTLDVPVSGLNDGTNRISVFAGQNDLSFDIETLCDLTPTGSAISSALSQLPAPEAPLPERSTSRRRGRPFGRAPTAQRAAHRQPLVRWMPCRPGMIARQ